MRISHFLWIFLLSAGLCGGVAACSDTSPETLRPKALAAAKAGDWKGALSIAESGLTRHPTEYTLLTVAALACEAENENSGDFSDALHYASKLTMDYPGDFEANALMGRLKMKSGSPKEAKHFLESAAKADSMVVANMALLGQAYQQLGEYNSARQVYEYLIRNDSFYRSYFSIYNELGICYLNLNNYAQAEAMFRQALSLAKGGGKVRIYLNLGRLFDYYTKESAKAIGAYRQFLIQARVTKAAGFEDRVEKVTKRCQYLAIKQRQDESAARRAGVQTAPNTSRSTTTTPPTRAPSRRR